MILAETAPYGIINFDALWWIVMGVAITLIVSFYMIVLTLTRPIKGDPDSIFYKKVSAAHRGEFMNSLKDLETLLTNAKMSPDDIAEEVQSVLIKFLQTKTKVDITGYTYAQLSEGGAPDDLLEVISQSYYILFSSISENEKQHRAFSLLDSSRKVVSRWR